jgi:hypothetical protein
LFDFAQIDIINLRDAEKRPMPIKLDIFPQWHETRYVVK